MTSFKSGSGDLDFDSGSENDDREADGEGASGESAATAEPEGNTAEPEGNTDDSHAATDDRRAADRSQSTTDARSETYPYFVRRNNVTDERDQRIEVHLRKVVSRREAAFRSELADQLDTEEVAKTDAREFALKFAFQHPEKVAELMREEGFGVLE